MTPEEIKAARIAAGLTQARSAELVGVHIRTWQKWEQPEGTKNHRAMPESAWRLFKLVTAGDVKRLEGTS